MRALARIVAEADGRGGTRLAELSGEAPLLPRRTLGEAPAAWVHLVGGAAGPLGGDDLRIEIEVGPGARLAVRTVAASLVLPGRGRSRTVVRATVAAGGSLDWRPEPVIAARGCDHRAETRVDLDPGARLVWSEELVCGRHDEACGDLTAATTIRQGGAPLYRQDLAVGPRAAGWNGPAVLADARAVGSMVLVDVPIGQSTVDDGVDVAVMPLPGGATVVSAVARQAHDLRRALTSRAPAGPDRTIGPCSAR